MTLVERHELQQEKVNQMEVLNIAANPYELSAGVGYFQWTLRNPHESEWKASGEAIEAFKF